MAFSPRLLFYLRQKNTGNYYQVSSGSVTTVLPSLKKAIYTPKGWENMVVDWKRNENKSGVYRTQTNPQEFVKDGAQILRYIYLNEGVEGACELVVTRGDRFSRVHSEWVVSDIDFSNFKGSQSFATANLMEGGLVALVKAYESTPFEIPITGAGVVGAYMDGFLLYSEYEVIGGGNPPTTYNFNANEVVFPPLTGLTIDQSDYFQKYVTTGVQNLHTDVTDLNNYTLRVQQISLAVVLNLTFDIEWTNINAVQDVRMRIRMISVDGSGGNGVLADLYIHPTLTGNGQTERVNTSTSVSLTIPADRYIKFRVNLGNNDSTINQPVQVKIYNFNLQISANGKLPPSNAYGFRYKDYWALFGSALTSGQYSASSIFLSNSIASYIDNVDEIPYNDMVTTGDSLRQLGTSSAPAKIRSTLAEIEQDITSRYDADIGIENNQIVIEKLDHFYQSGVLIANVGAVSDFEWSPATDFMGNQIKIGYDPQDLGQLNGRYEFLNTAVYKVPITRVVRDIDFVTSFRSGMYDAEYTRANLTEKQTTDAASDNATFVLNISNILVPFTTNLYELARSGVVTGLPDNDNAYNVWMSTGRMIRRKARLLKATLYGLLNQVLKFQTTDKNQDVNAALLNGFIPDDSDVDVSALPGTPYFKPTLFKFKCSLPDDFVDSMDANPYGVVRFTWNGLQYDGFIMSVSVNIGRNQATEMILLSSPLNNLNNLS